MQLTIHTDGAARGNPGPAAYAYTIQRDGQPLIEVADRLAPTTCNQAEYTALVRALEHAQTLGTEHSVVVHSDSELMVKQMRGEYRVKNEELRALYEDARELSKEFAGGVRFVHVRREKNKRADELCNEVLDGKRGRAVVVTAPEEKEENLDEAALACLRAAGVAAPEAVWLKLKALMWQHIGDFSA